MESKELREYIQGQINNKIPKEEIIKVLKEQGGWIDKDIDEAFSSLEQNVENQYSTVEKPEEKLEQSEIQAQTFEKKTSNHGLQIIVAVVVLAIISVGGYFGMKHFSTPTDLDEPVAEEVENGGTVEELPRDYEIKAGEVYYQDELIEGADPETFEILCSIYAKDKNNAYYELFAFENAHVETFDIVDHLYAKDKNHVYLLSHIIKDADSATFEYLGGNYSKDKTQVYTGFLKLLQDVDVITFQYVGDGYSKDINNVYYKSSQDIEIVEGANVYEFQVLTREIEGYGYAKDTKNVYREGEILKGFDAVSFEVVGSYGYSWYTKDKTHVYDDGEIIEGVDPANCTVENLDGCKASTK